MTIAWSIWDHECLGLARHTAKSSKAIREYIVSWHFMFKVHPWLTWFSVVDGFTNAAMMVCWLARVRTTDENVCRVSSLSLSMAYSHGPLDSPCPPLLSWTMKWACPTLSSLGPCSSFGDLISFSFFLFHFPILQIFFFI